MRLAVVAGEASGDLHAAKVIHELKTLDPSLTAFGIGGDLLAAEGVELLHHAREMAIVGLFNVLRHLRFFRRVFDELLERIERERPDAILLVDYPEFNLRVAKRCKALGVKVLYYISPQVWAWRRGRVKGIARVVDHMLVIFPFEAHFYREHGVPVTYVGHPLVDELPSPAAKQKNETLQIALLPGSRKHEVHSLLPPMLDAVKALGRDGMAVDAFVIRAPTITAAELLEIMAAAGTYVRIVPYDGGETLAGADVALSSSGTATLEAAIVGTPVIVMYRLSPLTYLAAKRLVKVPHFSLVNIVAGREVVPELIQHDVNGERIAAEVRRLLEPARQARVREALAHVRASLGQPGASKRAAAEVFRMLTAHAR
jgi:lipid-A-disaccharide synthase